MANNFVPRDNDNGQTLGTTNKKWSNVYAKNINLNGSSLATLLNNKQNKLTAAQLANLNEDHSKYLTEHQDISGKVDRAEADYVVDSGRTDTYWYRKYKSGWIEQGGVIYKGSSLSASSSWDITVNSAIGFKPMADTNYSIIFSATFGTTTNISSGQEMYSYEKTVIGFKARLYNRAGNNSMPAGIGIEWVVRGMAQAD